MELLSETVTHPYGDALVPFGVTHAACTTRRERRADVEVAAGSIDRYVVALVFFMPLTSNFTSTALEAAQRCGRELVCRQARGRLLIDATDFSWCWADRVVPVTEAWVASDRIVGKGAAHRLRSVRA